MTAILKKGGTMSKDRISSSICKSEKNDWNNLTHDDIINLNTYDFMAYLGKRVINPGGIRGRNQVLDILQPERGSHVLEIGGGSGHAACHIAKNYRCQVTTIDISPRSVGDAEKLITEKGLSSTVRCEVGDVNSLGFTDEAFDYILCQAVIMFVDQRRALSEVRRVLKHGGVFAGLEFCWKKDPPPVVREKTYSICGCKTLEFHSLDTWLEKLRDAGFVRVKGAEHPFSLLSPRGFLRDEGWVNSLQIAGKVLLRRANIARMSEIWSHFSRNIEYFSYAVISGEKVKAGTA